MQSAVLSLSLPFSLFLINVLLDQIVIVQNRASTLEKVRMHELRPNDPPIKFKKRGYHNWQVVFGGPFSWRWFFPLIIEGKFSVEELYD
jgi:hypothetical protein